MDLGSIVLVMADEEKAPVVNEATLQAERLYTVLRGLVGRGRRSQGRLRHSAS